MNPDSDSGRQRVAILGASDRPDRYAYQAFCLLQEVGHEVIPVHPARDEIEGVPVVRNLSDLERPIDTLTLYVRPSIAESMGEELIDLAPGRVIFNPGTESTLLEAQLDTAGIPWERACTLVLLQTGQF